MLPYGEDEGGCGEAGRLLILSVAGQPRYDRRACGKSVPTPVGVPGADGEDAVSETKMHCRNHIFSYLYAIGCTVNPSNAPVPGSIAPSLPLPLDAS